MQDTLDVLVENFGWKKDEVKLGSIDTKDAKVGQTLIYEFDIQVGDVIVPLRLSEEVSSWQYLQELPAPLSDSGPADGADTKERKDGAIDVWQPEAFSATLAPFEVAGPVDLWIQDAKELRLSMPVRHVPMFLTISFIGEVRKDYLIILRLMSHPLEAHV